jgi:hypothetical protein
MTPRTDQNENWKTPLYVMGAVIGSLFGLITAYFYTRAAEEDAERHGGKPERVPTLQVIALLTAALGLMRQISELGKPQKKK